MDLPPILWSGTKLSLVELYLVSRVARLSSTIRHRKLIAAAIPNQFRHPVKTQGRHLVHIAAGATETTEMRTKDMLEHMDSPDRGDHIMMYRFLGEEDHYGAFLVAHQRDIGLPEEAKLRLLLNFKHNQNKGARLCNGSGYLHK